MFVIIGSIIVLGCVIGGYLLGHGNLGVLWQPAEFIIILGAALGSFIIANTKSAIIHTIKDLLGVLTGKHNSKAAYIELFMCLYHIFSKVRKEGIISIEADIEKPESSSIFQNYKSVLANKKAFEFICDNFKVFLSTKLEYHELDTMMEIDIEAHSKEMLHPAHAVNKVADALPGLGIVAAVLGVVLTMGKINEPPEVLGHHIGAALIGTFIGVLMCYGFVGPIATNMEHSAKEKEIYLMVIKAALLSFMNGAAPMIALEAARRAIPGSERPSFAELEEQFRGMKGKV